MKLNHNISSVSVIRLSNLDEYKTLRIFHFSLYSYFNSVYTLVCVYIYVQICTDNCLEKHNSSPGISGT